MAKNPTPPSDDDGSAARGPIEHVRLRDAIEERYLSYALSTIMGRALPDVRDGLKPVHRRILYTMQRLNLSPPAAFMKCARIVGEAMGKYHPHGNLALYEALVRLAQDFSVRYPLIEGQGNFGNIDGDNAAADRYTEARLSGTSVEILEGLDEDSVDFRPNYDGREMEPVVLPCAFPNLLANGSSGIAVGMATNIAPHNVDELCAALLHLIKHPNATIEKLVEFIPGPDFPTGGVLVEPHASIIETYKTGRGGFRLRCKWEREETGRGTYNVVITEIPYQVQKSKLVEKIADLISEKKLPHVNDVRDESAEIVRLVIEPHGGPRADDGEPVPADRARNPLLAKHERAVGGADPERAELARCADAMARAPRGGAAAAHQLPAWQDCAPARSARRLFDCLPQH
jgi:topoisomerase IV subunit A